MITPLSRDKEIALSAAVAAGIMTVKSPTTMKRKMIIRHKDDDDDDYTLTEIRPYTPHSPVSEHHHQEEAYGKNNNDSSKKRRRSMVRFTSSPAAAYVPEGDNKISKENTKTTKVSLNKENRCRKITKKAKLNNGIGPSISWYTPRERKHIQHSTVLAVKRKESCGLPLSCSSTSPSSLSSTIKEEEEEEEEEDHHRSLDRHSIRNRKR
jgi:hypothetical protein